MSSTNRGGDRHAADYYLTPQWAIKDFLVALSEDDPHQFGWADGGGFYQAMASGISILDPCAGGDVNHDMAYPKAIANEGWPVASKLTTVDWREDSKAEHKADFLMWQPQEKFDMAITNPPFAIAQEVIDRCFQIVRPGGLIVMLLRLNFFGGAKRLSWWQRNMPVVCYVHSRRIGFTDDGKTNSIEYMHACWIVGEQPRFTALRVI